MDGGTEVGFRDGWDSLVTVVRIEHRWGLRWVWKCLIVNMRALRSVKEDSSEVERYLATCSRMGRGREVKYSGDLGPMVMMRISNENGNVL